MMRTTIVSSTAFALLASCSLFVAAPEAPSAAAPQFAAPGGETAPRTAFAVRDPAYPLDVCVVSGRRLGADAVTFAVGGRSVTTCCGKCQAEVESHPEPYLAQLSAAALTAQLGNYPLTVCPVSGDVLGESGEPSNIFVNGVLVRLCGDGCLADARENADTIVETVLAAAFAQQQKTYPLDTCIVSGRPLGKTPVATMVGTTLVKFCCPECAHRFDENADAYLPRLATALCERTSPARIDHHATTCCVTGKPLGADAVTFTVGTERFTTCSNHCRQKVEADPTTFARLRDAASAREQLADYPLDRCLVSGRTLGSMGTPVDVVLDGTLVRLCCNHCVKAAESEAEDLAAQVRAAAMRAQQRTYPLTTCAVCQGALRNEAIATVVGTTLVRVCGRDCEAKLALDPTTALASVAAARARQGEAPAAPCCGTAGSCCCETPAK